MSSKIVEVYTNEIMELLRAFKKDKVTENYIRAALTACYLQGEKDSLEGELDKLGGKDG